jgi:hypothetical protein
MIEACIASAGPEFKPQYYKNIYKESLTKQTPPIKESSFS